MKVHLVVFLIFWLGFFGCKKDDGSVPEEISLQNEPPLSFNLMEVPNGATNIDTRPVLSWGSAKNPKGSGVTYDLYLNEETNPTTIYKSDISETAFQIEERLNLISKFYWRVVAKDSNGQSSQSDIHYFTTRNLLIPEQPLQTSIEFPPRVSQTSLSFKNSLWVMAGFEDSGQIYKDVWNSDTGSTWGEVGNNALIRPKWNHSSVVYNDQIWILGGRAINEEDNLIITHDVWSSSDGSSWKNLTSYTNFFPERVAHTSIVHDNKIFVIGGLNDDPMNDIWQYDGSWSQVEVSSSVFDERFGHSSVVFDNKIWVIGGRDDLGRKNDVWYSSDGTNWILATTNADFPPIAFHESVVFGGKMWIVSMDGQTDKYWHSDNGIDWLSIDLPEEMYGRYGQTATVHDDKLYLIGGVIDRMNEEVVNHVWILE